MEGMPIRCRAAVTRTPQEELSVEEILVAPPQAGEVRVKILYSSLCHSDLHFWKHPGRQVLPCILGHEGSGVVESVGEGVTELQPGDSVLTLFQPECKNCKLCKLDKTNLCEKMLKFPLHVMASDGKPRFSTLDGSPIYHCLGCSTFSEYTVMATYSLAKIDSSFPHNKACLLSCGVPTGLGSAWKLAKVEPESTVAVIGLGTVGLAVIEAAKIAGASRILAIDVQPMKLELAKDFGATDLINPKDSDKPLEKVVHEMIEGGVDYSFECVGKACLAMSALECCSLYGTSVVVGVCKPDDVVDFAPSSLLCGRQWKSGFFGGFKGRSETQKLVELCTKKELDLDKYITHRIPFSSINEGFQLLNQGGMCIKCVFHMDDKVDEK